MDYLEPEEAPTREAVNGMPGLRQVFVPQPIMGKTAAQLRAAAPGLGLHVAHWCFVAAGPNPWAASSAEWAVYLERLRWWSEEAAQRHFLGIALVAQDTQRQ